MCYKYFEAKYYMIRYVWCVLKVECSEQLWDHEGSFLLETTVICAPASRAWSLDLIYEKSLLKIFHTGSLTEETMEFVTALIQFFCILVGYFFKPSSHFLWSTLRAGLLLGKQQSPWLNLDSRYVPYKDF